MGRTSSTSPPTRRWPRCSVTTASAPSAWPSSSPATSPNSPKQTFHPSFLPKKNQMKFKSTQTSVSIAYKRHTSFIMPHPTNNHAPLPSFLELSLEDAKAEDFHKYHCGLQRPELTTEPFSRLRDEPASMLDGPFLGRGRVGENRTFVEMRRP